MTQSSASLILLRHARSMWNDLNLFTGWVDVPLSIEGYKEAEKAGGLISHLPIDIVFTSALVRSQMTAFIAMSMHQSKKVPLLHHPGEGRMESWARIYNDRAKENCIPMIAAWQLNERMYGELQGLNKKETIEKYGESQVKLWRRSYEVAPPNGESLEMTAQRTVPYFEDVIIPYLKQGKSVFICAHGNSLRSIIMVIEKMSKETIVNLEIETGKPMVYKFIKNEFKKAFPDER